jgi:hypothetical protein
MTTIKSATVFIKIIHDDHPEDPREWDNLSKMIFWHSRYTLGDKHDFLTPLQFKRILKKKDTIVLPVYMYEHSGIALATEPFSCRWDSGFLGWLYTTRAVVREWFSKKRVTNKILYQAYDSMRSELETYNQYIEGDVWGYEIYSLCPSCGKPDEVIDSCWGFYGPNPEKNGMLDHIDPEYHSLITNAEHTYV